MEGSCISVSVQQRRYTLRLNEVPTMITRVAIPLLLLPLLALALPLMFAWAWVREVISERTPSDQPSTDPESIAR
jgi:hypothetical protein